MCISCALVVEPALVRVFIRSSCRACCRWLSLHLASLHTVPLLQLSVTVKGLSPNQCQPVVRSVADRPALPTLTP